MDGLVLRQHCHVVRLGLGGLSWSSLRSLGLRRRRCGRHDGGLRGSCGRRCLLRGLLRWSVEGGNQNLGVDRCRGVLGHGKTNLVVIAIKYRQKPTQERVAENEQRTTRRGHVEGHQRNAAGIPLVNVVTRLQVQNLLPDHETEVRESAHVAAIKLNVELILKLLDNIGWPCKQRSPSIHGNLASRLRAEPSLLVVVRNVINAYLPIRCFRHWNPERFRGRLPFSVSSEGDFTAACVR
mmetsp:Transcript_45362/g.98425  ORF Transcript_45362/g.98425 Transcript_45362/m.98425 type:complete len:238 (+) Transcript_45362:241-954(+)